MNTAEEKYPKIGVLRFKKKKRFCASMNTQHIITLAEAQTLTHAYQNSQLAINQPISLSIPKSEIESLISQTECSKLRMYFGMNEQNKLTIVLIAADNNGNDITSGIILDRGDTCPVFCPPNPSPLM